MNIEKYANDRALAIEILKAPPQDKYHDYKAISRTALEWIIPSSGGSVEKYSYLTVTAPVMDEEVSKSMNIGTGVHLYAQDPTAFEMKTIKKPGPGLKAVIDALPEIIDEKNITSFEPDVIRVAREVGYGGTWSSPVIFKKVMEDGLEYLASLRDKTPNLFYASAEEAYVISQCISSLSSQRWIVDPGAAYGHDWEVLTEAPFLIKMGDLEFKILVDRLLVNHDEKSFIVEDLKTTRFSIPEYLGYTRYIPDGGTIQKEYVIGKTYDSGIHRQLGFYKGIVQLHYPGYKCKETAVLAQQTTAPYAFERRIIPDIWMDIAQVDLTEGLNLVFAHEHAKSYDL